VERQEKQKAANEEATACTRARGQMWAQARAHISMYPVPRIHGDER